MALAASCAAGVQLANRLPRPLAVVPIVALPITTARALPRGRVRAYATFVAQMVSYLNAFELPHRHPVEQRDRVRIMSLVRADRALGGGVVPNSRLQQLRHRPRLRAVLDRALGAVYFAWAPQRHVALLWLFYRHPRHLARTAALVSAVFDITLVFQAAVPMAPPWLAAKYGFITEPLSRVTVDASHELPVPEEDTDETSAANPWATMPSPHTATAAVLALALRDVDARAGALAGLYAATLAVALVYLGEHYVVDVAAGLALAAALHAAEPLARDPLSRVAAAVLR